jgi:fluoride exporter
VTWVYVALGAAAGAPLRYVAGHLLDARLPRGTILVNWAGSLLLGWFSGLGLGGHTIALLGTGFCGALTTYSSFMVQTHDRGPRLGGLNVVLTVVPALLLSGLGFSLGATTS